MKCEATGCNGEAKYTKNVTIADSFDVDVQLCQMHYLIDPYCTYRTDGELKRIQTIRPDERGRVSLLPYLKLIGWKPGQAVKIDLIETVEIITTD